MNEQIRKAAIPAIVGAVGLSVGGVLGYILGRRKATVEFQDAAVQIDKMVTELEVEATKWENLFRNATKNNDVQARLLKDVKIQSISLVDNADGSAPGHIVSVTPVEEKTHNIFDDSIPGWDWEAELNSRSTKTIYVIAKSEFFADDMGYRQSTVTWYEGDRTLADDREMPIYNWSSLVGTELMFGHGSEDDNVVYIRNEALRTEYEVCRDPSAYGVEVAGFELHGYRVAALYDQKEYTEQDIRHSHAPLKFRWE